MKILITGGAGHVGRKLRREFAGRFALIRTFDMAPAEPIGPNEESVVGDIADMAAVESAMQGMDAVIHMAAEPNEAPIETILPANVIGTWNVYEAARRCGVKRVIFGSSNHAVGFYPRAQRIDELAPVRPDSRYGLSKCWGEATAALYADKYGVKSLILRIGNAADLPGSERALAIWVSGRDLAQLCAIGLEHPDIHCNVVFGVSNNAACWYDNSAAYQLGYKPQDRAEDHVDAAMAGEAGQQHEPADLYFQGGPFCAREYAGGPVPPKS